MPHLRPKFSSLILNQRKRAPFLKESCARANFYSLLTALGKKSTSRAGPICPSGVCDLCANFTLGKKVENAVYTIKQGDYLLNPLKNAIKQV